MTALVDAEGFEMPLSDDGNPLFRAEFVVMNNTKSDEMEPERAELWVHMPEYFEGSGMDVKHFAYDSLGLLHVNLDDVISNFMENYCYAYGEMTEAKYLRDKLLSMANKLSSWIDAEELISQ